MANKRIGLLNATGSFEAARDGFESRPYVLRLEPDLGVREAERRQARRDVRLVAPPIARLLRRRAVISEAIRLHDQVKFGPVRNRP